MFSNFYLRVIPHSCFVFQFKITTINSQWIVCWQLSGNETLTTGWCCNDKADEMVDDVMMMSLAVSRCVDLCHSIWCGDSWRMSARACRSLARNWRDAVCLWLAGACLPVDESGQVCLSYDSHRWVLSIGGIINASAEGSLCPYNSTVVDLCYSDCRS